jgi:hypothetical protein
VIVRLWRGGEGIAVVRLAAAAAVCALNGDVGIEGAALQLYAGGGGVELAIGATGRGHAVERGRRDRRVLVRRHD